MKKFFRFFRGELNGYILRTICTFLNTYILNNGAIQELLYHATCNWNTTEETSTKHRTPLRSSDIFNIGLVSGLPNKRIIAESTLGSIRLVSDDIKKQTHQYLFDMIYEKLIKPDDIGEDINFLAGDDLRSSLIEDNASFVGYVLEGEENNLFDKHGNIIQEKIFADKPTDKAYNKFYSIKYLTLENLFEKQFTLSVEIYKNLFESVQQVRRTGVSMTNLLSITKTLAGGYVYKIELKKETNEFWFTLEYSLNNNIEDIYHREQRYQIWLILMSLKFPMITLKDRSVYE